MASKAFVKGFSRAYDMGGALRKRYNFTENAALADYKALREDWKNVGKEIQAATVHEISKCAK